MTWLVACEYSGRVRDALLARGVDAVSCDLLPTEADGPHIQGDVTEQLRRRWAGVIAHPPCTRLCNSGVRWLAERDLWADMREAVAFFLACLNANAPKVAVENPVMHGHAGKLIGKPSFSVQPWQFGDNFKKRTCFWTRGLPRLVPTSDLDGGTAIAECHSASPGPDRWRDRSRTYPGIAAAIADQWGVGADLFSFAHSGRIVAADAPAQSQKRAHNLGPGGHCFGLSASAPHAPGALTECATFQAEPGANQSHNGSAA